MKAIDRGVNTAIITVGLVRVASFCHRGEPRRWTRDGHVIGEGPGIRNDFLGWKTTSTTRKKHVVGTGVFVCSCSRDYVLYTRLGNGHGCVAVKSSLVPKPRSVSYLHLRITEQGAVVTPVVCVFMPDQIRNTGSRNVYKPGYHTRSPAQQTRFPSHTRLLPYFVKACHVEGRLSRPSLNRVHVPNSCH